jgi:hypothetical protein
MQSSEPSNLLHQLIIHGMTLDACMHDLPGSEMM